MNTLNFLESVFQNTEHINETAPNFRADMRETSNLLSIIEDTLGIMPIACGDLAFDHDAPGAFPFTEEFLTGLVDSMNVAPLLSTFCQNVSDTQETDCATLYDSAKCCSLHAVHVSFVAASCCGAPERFLRAHGRDDKGRSLCAHS